MLIKQREIYFSSIRMPIGHSDIRINSFIPNWFFMTQSWQQSFNTLTPFNFLFYSLHVLAPTGHPQVRYTIIFIIIIIINVLIF
jgi:hypothetical protein